MPALRRRSSWRASRNAPSPAAVRHRLEALGRAQHRPPRGPHQPGHARAGPAAPRLRPPRPRRRPDRRAPRASGRGDADPRRQGAAPGSRGPGDRRRRARRWPLAGRHGRGGRRGARRHHGDPPRGGELRRRPGPPDGLAAWACAPRRAPGSRRPSTPRPRSAPPAASSTSCWSTLPGARVTRRASRTRTRARSPAVRLALALRAPARRLGLRVSDTEVRASLDALGLRGGRDERRPAWWTCPSWRATKDVRCPRTSWRRSGGSTATRSPARGADRRPRPRPAPAPPQARAEALRDPEPGPRLRGDQVLRLHRRSDTERLGIAGVPHLGVRNPQGEEQDRLAVTAAAGLLRAAARNQAQVPSARLWESTRLVLPRRGAPACPTEVRVIAAVGLGPGGGGGPRGAPVPRAGRGPPSPPRDGPRERPRGPGRARGGRGSRPPGPGLAPPGPAGGALRPRARPRRGRGGRSRRPAGLRVGRARRPGGGRPGGRAGEPGPPRGGLPAGPPLPRGPLRRGRRRAAADARRRGGATIAGVEPEAVREVRLFDVYEGKGIPDGHRSLAFTCELLDPEGRSPAPGPTRSGGASGTPWRLAGGRSGPVT